MRTIERVRREGEALMEEVSREYHLAFAGLKPQPELLGAYRRHAAAYDDDALALVLERWQNALAGSDERRSARMLLEWLVETRAGRELASEDERIIAWEAAAIARLSDGRQVPYQRIAIEIANATDRGEREALDDARAALVEAELVPLKRNRLLRERELVEALGIGDGYVATEALLSGIDLHALSEQCERLLAGTQAMWDDVLRENARRGLGLGPGEVTRPDLAALLRAPQFDGAFPAGAMEVTVRNQLGAMSLDPSAGGRIHYDVGEREGKRSRAFCAPVRVPDEVHLVLRPHGGAGDWRTFLHELGHALHFANVRRDLPFESRWLGDNSVTEGYAMLFDHLLHDDGWLTRYTDLRGRDMEQYRRAVAFEELQFLRRYCGKLRYELALHGGEVPWSAVPDLYVATLEAATAVRYRAADAFVDIDPRFYAARYLRAWQLQALLTETLRERFDEDWYRNPRAGPWMRDTLFAEGQRELAHELAERVGAGEGRLSFAPVIRAVERALQ